MLGYKYAVHYTQQDPDTRIFDYYGNKIDTMFQIYREQYTSFTMPAPLMHLVHSYMAHVGCWISLASYELKQPTKIERGVYKPP